MFIILSNTLSYPLHMQPGIYTDVEKYFGFFKDIAATGAAVKIFAFKEAEFLVSHYLGLVDMWWVEYLNLSYLVFFIGLSGTIFNYKNFLITMLNIELMYLGVLSSMAIASVFSYAVIGQIYALFILILAAAESAIGLGLLVVSFKYRRSLNFNLVQRLRA